MIPSDLWQKHVLALLARESTYCQQLTTHALQVDIAAPETRAAEFSLMTRRDTRICLIPAKSCGISQGCSKARFMFVWLKWSPHDSVWACIGCCYK